MIQWGDRKRNAFSLLEVIIATAILAGSAMVLFSLISLGTKYGNRAEERTIAVSQAQSVLDEFVAGFSSQEVRDEVHEGVKGVLPSNPPRSFRIVVTPFELGSNASMLRSSDSTVAIQTNLFRVKIELFESKGQLASEAGVPLCELSRLVRRSPQNGLEAVNTSIGVSVPQSNENRKGRGVSR